MNDLDRNGFQYTSILLQLDLIRTLIILLQRKERFDVSISGKLEGIGARLQRKMTTEISELISGGPAWRGKDLEAGDSDKSSTNTQT
jgi:carboxyl-terminal processing protease